MRFSTAARHVDIEAARVRYVVAKAKCMVSFAILVLALRGGVELCHQAVDVKYCSRCRQVK